MFRDCVANGDLDLRPYEKCEMYGASVLSDSELLAAIIRSGVGGLSAKDIAKTILEKNPTSGLNGLYHLSFKDLLEIKGIGKAKAAQISCICELSRRIARQKAINRLDFSSSSSIANYYMEELRYLTEERVILVLLDVRCCMISDKVISIGTDKASLISVKEIFKEAIKNGACFIVLLHNHPSGVANPSRMDVEVTKQVIKAGKIFDIPLIDHIIIGDNSYMSFNEAGYLVD